MVSTEVEEVAEVAVEATIVALEEEGVVVMEQVVVEGLCHEEEVVRSVCI